jgi:hypothetical protein
MEGIVEIQQIITNASLVEKVAATPQTFAINANTISNKNNNTDGIKKADTVNETDEILEPVDDSEKKNGEEGKKEDNKEEEERAYNNEAPELEVGAYNKEGVKTITEEAGTNNQENLNKKNGKQQHINVIA